MQDLALQLVNLGGHGVQLHAQARGRLINQVNGFVRQETIGDVAVRERGGSHQRGVLDAHAVVDFVALFEPAQDGNGGFDARLAHIDRLEAAFQGRVFLDVLAIFIQRGGADGAKFAPRKLRLHDVGRVRGALRRASAHQRVQLIYEENDFALARNDFFEKGLEAVFKLAAILGPGDHGAKVHGHEPLVLQRFRHVAADDAPGQTFRNGRFAHARLADEHGVVLGSAGQDLHHAADFLVAADDRVNLALARERRQVAPVFFQRLKLVFRIGVGDALVATQLGQGAQDRVAPEAMSLKELLERGAAFIQQPEQQMLGADVLVLELAGLGLGGVEHLFEAGAEEQVAGTDALDFMAPGQFPFEFRFEIRGRDADFFEQFRDEAFGLADQGQQQMLAVHFLVRIAPRDALRLLEGFLGFDGEPIKLHALFIVREGTGVEGQ